MAKKEYRDTPATLLEAILAMQDKIIEKTPEFEGADLTYVVEFASGGERVLPNPVVTEFRALIKDYASALRAYKEIAGGEGATESNRVAELRQRLKVMG